MNPYLFVYGTLRRASGHPSHGKLMRQASLSGHGSVRGRLFDLGAYPGAVPDPTGDARVRGELYRLHRPSVAFDTLDVYEGCVPEQGEALLFRRILSEVQLDEGASRTAWVYWYAGSLAGARVIPRGDFLGPVPVDPLGEARGLRLACPSRQLQRPAAEPSHQEKEPC